MRANPGQEKKMRAKRHPGSGLHKISAGLIPLPLLHSLSGGGGAWDEVLALGLIGAFVVGLAGFLYLGSRRKSRERSRGRSTPRRR